MHAVRTRCEVLDVGKCSHPTFGPFWQVFGSILGVFFSLPMHLGCGTFELSPFVAHFQPFLPILHPPILNSPHYGDPEKAGVM